jgi:hypothetical protein
MRAVYISWIWVLFAYNVAAQNVFTKKFTPLQMKEEAALLKNIVEANHPSVYWHITKDHFDSVYQQVVNGITVHLNENEYRNKLALWLNEIKCGHTVVRYAKRTAKKIRQNKTPQFPLLIKVWADSMVVYGSLNKPDTLFKNGTIITAINGRSCRQIIDSIFPYISTDGNSINHKNQVLSNSFGFWYTSVFGADSNYRIQYIDRNHLPQTAEINSYKAATKLPAKKSTDTVQLKQEPGLSKKAMKLLSQRSLNIDTVKSIATMRLNTFTGSNLKQFFSKSFEQINQLSIKHLIIDLRSNGGGRVSNSTALTQYIINHYFKIADSVVANGRNIKYGRYIHPFIFNWLAMKIFSKKMQDGKMHFNMFEKREYLPKNKNWYKGKVYLLQGGNTFSASTMFIGALKGQSNVTVVGEETGGGSYGNSAMLIPSIVLPHSRLRISLPLYRVVLHKGGEKGCGIMPDVLVPPSSNAIAEGKDVKIEKVYEMIKNRKLIEN